MSKGHSTDTRDQIFRNLGVRYLKQTEYPFSLSSTQTSQSAYYRNYKEDFLELNDRYGSYLSSCLVAPCSVEFMDETLNYGLIAETSFQEGDFLAQYTGLVGRARRHRRMQDSLGGYSTDYAWTFPVRKGWFPLELDGRLQGNETRFINHSFHPNLKMEHTLIDGKWLLFLLACKSIERGEQFTVDYGEEYWSGGYRELVLI